MDFYLIKAECRDKDGSTGTLTVKAHERDSESTSNEEFFFKLSMAADRSGLTIIGPMTVTDDPLRGK